MLSKKQFDILTTIEKNGSFETQRQLAESAGMSLGIVNKILTDLTEAGYISNKGITEKGLQVLEPYRVKRAIFIAAGFGSRMVPITLNTPKPLVRVKGQRIIDSLLDAVEAIGIEEIYVVRGYLAEQFDQLLYKYPNIQFIENPVYNEANNISSLMCVRSLLQEAYIFDGDMLLRNKDLVTKYQYCTNYLGVPVPVTDDWCFETKNKRITRITVGGTNCHQVIGLSYWTAEDGAKLGKHIADVYNSPGGKEKDWDQVPLESYVDEYKIMVRECTFDDIIEIDTFRELKQLDPTYDV